MDHEVVGEEHPPHPLLCMTNNLRPKLCWTDQLHQVFVRAVDKLGGPFKATPKHILKEMSIKGLTLDQCKSHLQKFRLQPHAKIRKPSKDGPPKKPKPAKVPVKGAGSSSLEPCQVNQALVPEDLQGASMAHIGQGDQVNFSTEGGDGRSLQIAVEEACKMFGNHQDDSIANSVSTVAGGACDGNNVNNDGVLAISMGLDDIFAATSGIIDSSLPFLPPSLNIYQQRTFSHSPLCLAMNQVIEASIGEYFQTQMNDNVRDSSNPLTIDRVIDVSVGEYFQSQMNKNIGDSPNSLTTDQVVDVSIGEYLRHQMNDNIGDSLNPLTTDHVIDVSVREFFQPQMNDNIGHSPNPLTTDQVMDVSVEEYFQHRMNDNIGDSPNLSAPPEVGTSSECSKEEDPIDMFLNMDGLETLCDMLP